MHAALDRQPVPGWASGKGSAVSRTARVRHQGGRCKERATAECRLTSIYLVKNNYKRLHFRHSSQNMKLQLPMRRSHLMFTVKKNSNTPGHQRQHTLSDHNSTGCGPHRVTLIINISAMAAHWNITRVLCLYTNLALREETIKPSPNITV